MRAAEQPDEVYLIAPEAGLEMTYGRLKEEAIRFGKALMRMGLSKGDKISFMLSNGYQTTKIFLGAMYGGFVIAPLNLQAQPSQLEYVVDHSDTKLIFFTEDQRQRVEETVGKVKRPVEMLAIDNDREPLFPAGEDLSGYTLPDVDEEDDALLLYTSGTTGLPKGVLLSHRNMVAGGQYTTLAHRLTPEDRALCCLPLYHINGEVVTAIAPLVSGGSVVMPHRFSASHFWEPLSHYRCTWFSVVPTIISYLVSGTGIEGKGYHLEQVRFGRSASSALPPSLHRAFEEKFNISIVETMGLTETAAPVLSNPLDTSKRKVGSPGWAVGNEARIVDRIGKEVPRGVEGEIMVRGDNVMKGYYKAPDVTARTLEPDGWLHTGDLGTMDGDGFVFVTGRLKELIIKGGENIAPREIDDALYRHPAVLEAAAVGIPDELYGEEILACVVIRPGITVTEQELRDHCLKQLGRYKTPKKILFLPDLPKGPSGKIQRLKCRDCLSREDGKAS
ncbi:MAG: AMP-binding protein [Deltaproteobacteria bacterium]|nr:AMP-binding protein [Deltaproteobacteria bacterium]